MTITSWCDEHSHLRLSHISKHHYFMIFLLVLVTLSHRTLPKWQLLTFKEGAHPSFSIGRSHCLVMQDPNDSLRSCQNHFPMAAYTSSLFTLQARHIAQTAEKLHAGYYQWQMYHQYSLSISCSCSENETLSLWSPILLWQRIFTLFSWNILGHFLFCINWQY